MFFAYSQECDYLLNMIVQSGCLGIWVCCTAHCHQVEITEQNQGFIILSIVYCVSFGCRLELQYGLCVPVSQLEGVCGCLRFAVCVCCGGTYLHAWKPQVLPWGNVHIHIFFTMKTHNQPLWLHHSDSCVGPGFTMNQPWCVKISIFTIILA